MVATNGRFLKMNHSFCDITGYSEEELLSLDFQSITHPDDLELSKKYAIEMMSGQISSFQLEKRYIHKLGHTVWVMLSSNRYGDIPNKRLYYIHQIVAITEYKQAEAMLRENGQRYHHLLKLLPEPIAVHSEGILVYLNDAGIKLVGAVSQEELVGKSILDFIHPDLQHPAAANIKQVLMGDIMGFSEYQLFRMSGEVVEVEVCSTKVNEFMGKSVIQTVIRDITERKRTNELLRKSDKLSAVGQLAAGVEHEIRNPLTAIKEFIQLLKSRTKESSSYFDIMLAELERTLVSLFSLLNLIR
ncbi:PAS domain S-box protein [Paenibacillus solisilvae]|uniref:histidine kinase n=1 Tax=Paenibacillus solisilvae TaxID=2486751 RepID=A0ABW0VYC9_9BACL